MAWTGIIIVLMLCASHATAVQASTHDADQDGVPDEWESRFGLNPGSGQGNDGPWGDPDLDGIHNARELADGTHPRGFCSHYLAEGATGTFFDTRVDLLNAHDHATAHVLLRFLIEGGAVTAPDLEIPPRSYRTISADALPGLAAASFSIIVDSDLPVVTDRTVTWAAGQDTGAHAEGAMSQPSPRWYFAEGVTHGPFDVFYLIQNPDATRTAWVHVSFLLSSGSPTSTWKPNSLS
jgi:hypothetical protein